jgi:hypothetical protein
MLTSRYLQNCSAPAVRLYGDLQTRIQEDIARRIAKTNYASEASEWQVQKLRELGASRAEINAAIGQTNRKAKKELANLFQDSASDSLKVSARLAKQAGVKPSLLPSVKDEGLAAITADAAKVTNGTLSGLTGTMAKDATRKLNKYLDAAYMDVASGAFTTEEAVKKAVERFAKDGVEAFEYSSGRKIAVEGAVRAAVRTGVQQMTGRLTLAAAKKVGIKKFRVTSHADSRPEHALWQGEVYTERELSTVCGYGDPAGLKGVNCRHDFYLYDDDINEPPEAQDEVDPEVYEAEQRQRYNERMIREWKREAQTLKAAGEDATLAERKVRDWQEKQRDHLADTKTKTGVDLARLYARESIAK